MSSPAQPRGSAGRCWSDWQPPPTGSWLLTGTPPGYALYNSIKAALPRFAESYYCELDDPAALTLAHPIGTRTSFFEAAVKQAAPQPWLTQSAEQAILGGVAAGRPDINPSRLFRIFLGLNCLLPCRGCLEQ